jgi:hypothetical protein
MPKRNPARRPRFEHHSDPVVPLRRFLLRQGRYAVFAFLLVAVSVSAGTIGYRLIADLSWIDAFYMASMILTGMGPVVEMEHAAAKLFSSFYALYSGVAFLSITAVFFAPMVHRLMHILHVSDEKGDD